jgi:hypothetical protein
VAASRGGARLAFALADRMPRGGRFILIAVIALSATVAVLVARPWRASIEVDPALEEEWTGLLSCLSGGRPDLAPEALARRARAVELEHLTDADTAEGTAKRRRWLSRCHTAAMRFLAVIKHTRDRSLAPAPLREAVDDIRDALENERLPSVDVLAQAHAEAATAGLRASSVPATSKVHEPIWNPESAPRETLARGNASLGAADPIPSRDAHVLLAEGGRERACIFPAPDLATHRCADVPPPRDTDDAQWRWESPNDVRGDFLTRTASGKSVVYRLENDLREIGTIQGEMLGVVGSGENATLLTGMGSKQISFYAAKAGRLELVRRAEVDRLSWLVPFGDEIVWAAASATSRDEDRVVVSRVERLAEYPRGGREIATVFERATPSACEGEGLRAVVLARAVSHAAHGWDGRGIVLVRDSAWWAPPIEVNAPWKTLPAAGVAYPHTPTLSCDARNAVVTWTDGDEQNVIRQLRCSRERCLTKSARLTGDHRNTLVADVGGRVLLVRNDTEHRTIRMRLARIDDLAQTPDVILLDEGASHAGPSMALYALVRERVALVLVRVARAEGNDVIAVRIDVAGAVSVSHAR